MPMPPHDLNDRVSGNDDLWDYFFSLLPQAIFGTAAFIQLVLAFVIVFSVGVLVIAILQMIIPAIMKFVKRRYDAIKAHYSRSYYCKYCIALRNRQAPVEHDGPNIIQEEPRQSFDENTHTVVGEANGKISVDLIEKFDSEERNHLLTYDGQHSIEEDKYTLHEDVRNFVGEGNSKSSIDLNEEANSMERNPLLKDDEQRGIKKDEESLDEDGQKSFEEEHDMSFVDLNKC